MNTRFYSGFAPVFLSAALAIAATTAGASAQERIEPRLVARSSTQTAQTQPAPGLVQNAQETRRELYRVLDQYPPALGRVLRLDPTLMTNANYLASYPQLAAFLAQYPDIPRNPGYYLERYDGNYSLPEPPDARREAVRMWRDIINFFGAFTVFCVITFALFSLLKYIVEYRRWHRVSKVNAEVHNKILDRFASNEEMLAYIDSPAGRRFLEATPIAPSNSGGSRFVAAPFARILWSVQLGILLAFLALGLYVVSGRVVEEIQQLMVSLAVVGFCLGLGFVLSAAASYAISRKLGLLRETSNEARETVV